MRLLTAHDDVRIGVRILDCDHREMCAAIEELQAAVAREEEQRRTGLMLRDLAGFTRSHFALEEGMMAASKFPGLARHRLHHMRMMQQVQALASLSNRSELTLNVDAMNFLSAWHAHHVAQDDLHYGLWLNAMGPN